MIRKEVAYLILGIIYIGAIIMMVTWEKRYAKNTGGTENE